MKRKDLIWKVMMGTAVALTMLPLQVRANNCEHERVYSAEGNTLVETCAKDCGYEEKAWLEINSEISLVYSGNEIKPLVMKHTDGWQGGKPEIIYANNIKAAKEEEIVEELQLVSEESLETEMRPENTENQPGDETEGKESEKIGKDSKEKKMPNGTLTVSGISITRGFAVEKAPLTITVSASAAYGDEEPQYELQYTGFVGEDNVETAITGKIEVISDYTKGTAVGTVCEVRLDITGMSAENYELTAQDGSFSVEPRTVEIDWGSLTVPYDGKAHCPEPRVKNVVTGEEVALAVSAEAQMEVGTYEIEVAGLEGAHKDNYKLPEELKKQFQIIPKELTMEWDATTFTYDGEVHKPTAVISGMINGDEVQRTMEGEGTDAGTYTAKVKISGDKSGNYSLPDNGETQFTIEQAPQTKPENLEAVKESILNKGDGKITGVTTEMEYKRKGAEGEYGSVDGTEITGLTSGTYLVRYAEKKPNYAASPDAEVTVTAEKVLTVSLPENQMGYTLTADKTEVGWEESVILTFELDEPTYIRTQDFVVKANDVKLEKNADGSYTISKIQENQTVTVEGVEPVITVEFLNETYHAVVGEVTFNQYTNKEQTLTINAVSGMKIYYAEKNAKMNPADIADEDWIAYEEPVTIAKTDRNAVIYAKATDSDEKVYYASTNGVVFDTIAPTISLRSGKYYTTQTVNVTDANLLEVTVEKLGTEEQPESKDSNFTLKGNMDVDYKIVAKDKAGNPTQKQINMEPIDTLKASIKDMSVFNMDPDDADKVEAVREEADKHYKRATVETEKALLKAILDNCDALLDIKYSITTKEANLKWTNGTKKTLIVAANGKDSAFEKLLIDGDLVEEKDASFTHKSTTTGTSITLKAAYLQKLKLGEHTIQVVYKDGSTNVAKLEILNSNPKTADNSHLTIWCLTAGLSAAGLAAIAWTGRKRRHQA